MVIKQTQGGWAVIPLIRQADQRCVRNQGMLFFAERFDVAIQTAQTLRQTHPAFTVHVQWVNYGKG